MNRVKFVITEWDDVDYLDLEVNGIVVWREPIEYYDDRYRLICVFKDMIDDLEY